MVRAPDYPIGIPTGTLGRFLERVEESWGTGSMSADHLPQPGPRRCVSAIVGTLRAARRESGRNQGIDTHGPRNRRAAHAPRHSSANANHPSCGRSNNSRGGRPIHRRTHSGRKVRGVAWTRPFPVGRRHRRHPRRRSKEFITGARRGPEADRVLATVMFTDIVGATERAVALGDRQWRNLLDSHHAVIREQLTLVPRP